MKLALTPKPLCSPEHDKQRNIPLLTEAQGAGIFAK